MVLVTHQVQFALQADQLLALKEVEAHIIISLICDPIDFFDFREKF